MRDPVWCQERERDEGWPFDDADLDVFQLKQVEKKSFTLREIREANKSLFHPNQDWFESEGFMDKIAVPRNLPSEWLWVDPCSRPPVASAADLALLYVNNPKDLLWTWYAWTSDTDRYNQRVYVGNNGKGLEIHRHLTITTRWLVPAFP